MTSTESASPAPLTDQQLDEILAHVPNCRYGCEACQAAPALIAEIRRLREQPPWAIPDRFEMTRDGVNGWLRCTDCPPGIENAVAMWQDGLGVSLAWVEALARTHDRQRHAAMAARHRSPGYPHEIPDHHGPADTCAMPVCVTARAQHEAADRIQDLTYELLAEREPKAGA